MANNPATPIIRYATTSNMDQYELSRTNNTTKRSKTEAMKHRKSWSRHQAELAEPQQDGALPGDSSEDPPSEKPNSREGLALWLRGYLRLETSRIPQSRVLTPAVVASCLLLLLVLSLRPAAACQLPSLMADTLLIWWLPILLTPFPHSFLSLGWLCCCPN